MYLTTVAEMTPPLHASVRAVMYALRQRLALQKQELYTFARALRVEDQKHLRALLAATQANDALVVREASAPTDEMLIESLVGVMRQICQVEKQQEGRNGIVTLDEWSRVCAA